MQRIKLKTLFDDFFRSERSGGYLLIACTVISLVVANSVYGDKYIHIWDTKILAHSALHWINEGLMSVFFLLIGLELEREIYMGELSHLRTASLPILAAIGGMVVPAAIYIFINKGTGNISGAGIPISTDIAFSLGILSLFGKRVPLSLKIFLMALAVIDDLGAILVIAFFYSHSINWEMLALALTVFALLLTLNRLKIKNLIPYLLGGPAMWYFMLHSGIHPTITGVLLAFSLPFSGGNEDSPSYKLQSFLNKPVALFILPLFALANTAIAINGNWYDNLLQYNSIGICAGLVLGKPIGVLLFSFAAVITGLCVLPQGLKWKHIMGAGLLAGIGFTMSIFITSLAFTDPGFIIESKIAILLASLTAGIAGLIWLGVALKDSPGQ